jgi:predicted MFS family arabinose efflux permease
MTGLYMGQALGGFGATIAEKFSWHQTFHWFGLIGIVYSLVLILFLREKKNVAALNNNITQKNSHTLFKGLAILLTNISFWIILFYFATHFICQQAAY